MSIETPKTSPHPPPPATLEVFRVAPTTGEGEKTERPRSQK